MTTWATCGDGRPREAACPDNSNLDQLPVPSTSRITLRDPNVTSNSGTMGQSFPLGSRNERHGLGSIDRAEVGWRVKRIFDEGRVSSIMREYLFSV